MRIDRDSFHTRPVSETDLEGLLEIYRQCEDFLALGPVATASAAMVLADLEHSRANGGDFCGIYRPSGTLVGVLDVTAGEDAEQPPYISLLMIAAPYRGRGLGTEVVGALEEELLRLAPFRAIEAGVQVNNPDALRFWQRQGFQVVSGPEPQPDGTTAFQLRKALG